MTLSAHIPSPLAPAAYPAGCELVATIGRIVFDGDPGESCIVRARDNTAIVAEGAAGRLQEGECYRFLGSWIEDPRYGRQFKAQAFLPHLAASRSGVVKYLSLHCPGIGQKTAEKLYDEHGASIVQGLREEPEAVIAAGALKADVVWAAHAALKENAKYEATTIELHSLFLGRGFGPTAIAACIARWKIAAGMHARRNPFSLLLAGIPRAGFRTCDRLYLDLGGNPAALKRQALAGWHAIREANNGSTWHNYTTFAKGIIEHIGASNADLPAACRLAQRSRLITDGQTCGRPGWVADPQQARNEASLAASVQRLFERGSGLWRMPVEQAISSHQAEQLAPVIEEPMIVLTGTPGTGKTHVAAAMVRAVATAHGLGSIAVAAPTGKAAVRITQAMLKRGMDIEATTIHRLLRVQRNGRDGQGWSFGHDREAPLPYRFVVIDEWSMCDTDLAAALFDAFAPGTCVLLVGDPYQLPPVSHGCPLRDMVNANLPRAHLTKVERNSGLITSACEAIITGKRVEFCDALDVAAGRNARFIECGTEEMQLAALRQIVEALRSKPNVNLREDFQVLTPRNDETRVSRKALNLYLQRLINPERTNDVKGKAPGFALHDKVICLSNTQTEKQRFNIGQRIHLAESWGPQQGALMDPADTFVANGDMGHVVAVSTLKSEIIVKFLAPDRYCRWRLHAAKKDEDAKLGGGKEDIALGYALTVHKSQGSEWEYVVVIVDPAGDRVASRELVYTALSRARTWVIVLGQRKVFDRQLRRAELPLRKTFLREMLLEIETHEPAGETNSGVLAAVAASGSESEAEDACW